VLRRGLEHQHEQRRPPQGERGAAGLGQSGQASGGDEPRIFEQFDPSRLVGFRERRRQRAGKVAEQESWPVFTEKAATSCSQC